MKAMILAAGYGTRLRPLTERLPKPLLPIGGRPLLEWNLLLLKKHGITHALINLHHLGDQIVETFGDGSRYGMRLAYSHEPVILGTGGGIKQAQPYFEDRPVLVLNGDTLSDCDLTALLETHRVRRALATLAVREDPHAAEWGAITMNATMYVGMAVTSHDPNQLARARFRDLTDVVGGTVGPVVLPTEPLGPSSRKTGLAISEIMYKPAPRTDGRNLEFIELFNSNPFYEDISGYRISGGSIEFTFPPTTILQGGAFLVVAAAPADVQVVYGITNVVGPYTGSLKKSGDVQLINDTGAVYLDVPYSNLLPWPVGADGTGHSIVLARPSYGEGDPKGWAISDVVGGAPGDVDAYRPSPLRSVVINELLAHTDPPLYDYVELYNHSNQAVDVSGCILSDHPTINLFTIPSGTVIPAHGFVYFDANQMGFRLNAVGETIYFKTPDSSSILDAVQFEGQENAVSMGRFPDGAGDFYPMQSRTPGTNNSPILVRDIVINEIMYKPITGDTNDTYVELYNKGTSAINVGGWRFISGISFIFPTNTTIAPGNYLVVANNATNLVAHYANLNSNNTLGNFAGKLAGGGERLALAMPDTVVSTNLLGQNITNIAWIVVDEVTYGTGGRWGQWANGGGSSLELVDPHANHRLAYNWADSDETQKAPWTDIEATGVLDNGGGYNGGPIDLVQIGMLDVGECLIDNVELRPDTSGPNYITNPDFESGLGGWTPQGDHIRSSLENSGYLSSRSLHLRCSDRIWTGANSVQGSLTNTTLAAGQTATLRFKARWLHGWPEVLLRVHGNWLEATGRMAIPANLGTPGAPNSRVLSNAGPAIYEVSHSPGVPAANQSIVITARVHDPDGIQSVLLRYRVDPSTSFGTVTMVDSGTGGDAVAGDGLYSATITGRAAGTVVAFYIQATDSLGAVTRFPTILNDNAPTRECVVYFGDPIRSTAFGTYYLWLTQTNINRWVSLPDLSNESMDVTREALIISNSIHPSAARRTTGCKCRTMTHFWARPPSTRSMRPATGLSMTTRFSGNKPSTGWRANSGCRGIIAAT